MDEFALDSKEVYKILKAKGIEFLHHANTVLTSITFIQQNSLLSRKIIEDNGWIQTPQKSDIIDKDYNVWDDVFLDGLDLHQNFKRQNYYGPILFRISLEILNHEGFSKVYVTRNNPVNWNKNQSLAEQYYANISDIETDYRVGNKVKDGQIIFTFKNVGKTIELSEFCTDIIIDNPHILSIDKTKSLGFVTANRIKEALNMNCLSHIPISIRHKNTIASCWCGTNYTEMRIFNTRKLGILFDI